MHGGFAFGLVGENATASKVNVEVDEEQFIRARTTAGGIAAENRGLIEKSYIECSSSRKDEIFAGTPKVIGGLVGFNYGGEILACYSKIDVTNSSSTIAGGLVGTTVGGSISYSYATGTVKAKDVYGGLVGSSLKESNLILLFDINDDIQIGVTQKIYKTYEYRYTTENLTDNTSMFRITNCLALHNWTDDEFKYIENSIENSNSIAYGLLIGTLDANNYNSTVIDDSKLSYYFAIKKSDSENDYYASYGHQSDVPNGIRSTGTGIDSNAIPTGFKATNKISGAGNKDFDPKYVENATAYYKIIFSDAGTHWSDYYDLSLITSRNPYPTLR